MKQNTMNLSTRIQRALRRQLSLSSRLDLIQEGLGRIESRLNANLPAYLPDIRDYEFKVYSQWGEDGIIDHLVSRVNIKNKTFVEFGVEDYTEANTLFLLKNRHWSGLVIDGSPDHMDALRRSPVFWRYPLRTEAAFITRDNINDIILRNGFSGELGLLSVDIDGNDYWVWQAIDCVNPCIVVAEYNSLFGPVAALSTPYDPNFVRSAADSTNMYYGASIAALTHLAQTKGYSLVSGNSAGNNLFFVRNDLLGTLRPLTPREAYVQAGFREAHSPQGEVLHLEFRQRQEAIADKPLVEITSGRTTSLREFL